MLKNIYLILIICGLTKAFSQNKTLDSILITNKASERATHYLESNKIIENDQLIIFTLLEYESNNYYNIIYKLDKCTEEIEKFRIEKPVVDNHCGAAIIPDNEGYIYIVVGSHNSAVQTYKSKEPWNISTFIFLSELKGQYTYPSLVVNPNSNTPYLLLRETNYNKAWNLSLFKLKKDKKWGRIACPIIGNYSSWKKEYASDLLSHTKGYQNFSSTLQIDRKNNIHLLFRIYEYLPKESVVSEEVLNPYQNLAASYMIGYTYSNDDGLTWKSSDNSYLEKLSPAKTKIVRGSSEPGLNSKFLDISNLLINSEGVPHFLFTERSNNLFKLYICSTDNFDQPKINEISLPKNVIFFGKPRIQVKEDKLNFILLGVKADQFDIKDTWGGTNSFNAYGTFSLKTLELEKILFLRNIPSWPGTLSYLSPTKNTWFPILVNVGSKSVKQGKAYLYLLK